MHMLTFCLLLCSLVLIVVPLIGFNFFKNFVDMYIHIEISLSEEDFMLLTHGEAKILRGISTDFAWPCCFWFQS
jgi:hypothetical protein